MKENDAKAFFDKLKFWKDEIDHECFKEGCDYAEVVNHYGHTEKSVRRSVISVKCPSDVIIYITVA